MFRQNAPRWTRLIAAVIVGLPLLACVTRPVDDPLQKTTSTTPETFPQAIERDVDLLFVIDNSGSMGEEQVNLAKQFPALIQALRSESLGKEPGSSLPCNAGTNAGCNIPNVHIGVVSSDVGAGNYNLPSCELPGGDKGRLQNKARVAGCQPPAKAFISYINGQTNIPGTKGSPVEAVKNAFKCIAQLGISGCGFEHQLESARRALDPGAKINPGFIRKDAFLAIVFITDEDDCSAQNPGLFDPASQGLNDPLGPLTSFRCFEFGLQCDINKRTQLGPRKNCVPAGKFLFDVKDRYIDFFKSLKAPGRMIVAAIAGPTNRVEVGKDGNNPVLKASCSSNLGAAVPALRIKAVIDAFGGDGQYNGGLDAQGQERTNICSPDFSPALKALGEKILGKLGAQCISSPVLTASGGIACQKGDAIAPGVTCKASCLDKISCDVLQVVGQGTAQEQSTQVPKCPKNLWYPANWEKDRNCGTTCPCWRVVRKPGNTPGKSCVGNRDGSNYALDILRKGEAPKGTIAQAACLTSPYKWNSAELGRIEQCL